MALIDIVKNLASGRVTPRELAVVLGLAKSERPVARDSSAQPQSRDFLHEYWATSQQDPARYARANPKRSEFLVSLLSEYVDTGDSILELGPNAGRNLHYLHEAGFHQLDGVEISPKAVAEMRSRFPDLSHVSIHIGAIEDHIHRYESRELGCVFTMAVLEHIHRDSEWVFGEIARIARTVVTIEDEQKSSERHFPRNYQHVFEGHGMIQVHALDLDRETHGLGAGYRARVFKHPA